MTTNNVRFIRLRGRNSPIPSVCQMRMNVPMTHQAIQTTPPQTRTPNQPPVLKSMTASQTMDSPRRTHPPKWAEAQNPMLDAQSRLQLSPKLVFHPSYHSFESHRNHTCTIIYSDSDPNKKLFLCNWCNIFHYHHHLSVSQSKRTSSFDRAAHIDTKVRQRY